MRVARMTGARNRREPNNSASPMGQLHSAAMASRQSNTTRPTAATPMVM